MRRGAGRDAKTCWEGKSGEVRAPQAPCTRNELLKDRGAASHALSGGDRRSVGPQQHPRAE